ncbi:MAG: hypothetical protein ACRDHJ_01355, partial [Actinomycetota bacterium]
MRYRDLPIQSRRSFDCRGSFDLVEVLASVSGAKRIDRALWVVGPHPFGRKGGDPPVGFLGDAESEFGEYAWLDGVDQRAGGVVDPVHVLRFRVGRGERHPALQL